MASNRLKLNPSKTEFLWCTTLRRRRLLDGSTFVLGDTEVRPADTILNLGVQFDSFMTMTAHVSQLVRGDFYHLRRIKTTANHSDLSCRRLGQQLHCLQG